MSLSVALIGCGRMGAFSGPETLRNLPPGYKPLSHADAIESLDELELVADCDPHPESLERVGSAFGVRRLYQDYRTLIDEVQPEIVAIATRTEGRCAMIEYAAEHGARGIHAEKPLGRSLDESRRACEAVRAHGVALTFGTYRRFNDTYRRAREMLQAGEIGPLSHVIIEHGRTSLMWDHPHAVDLLLYYTQSIDVESVQSTCAITRERLVDHVLDEDPIVETAYVRFADGVTGMITSVPGMNTRLVGTDGVLVVAGNGSRLDVYRKENAEAKYFLDRSTVTVEPALSGTQRAFRELIAAIQTGAQPSITAEEILACQRLLGAIALSALGRGEPISPDDVPDDFTITGCQTIGGRVCYA